jgi:hypothetical protein
MLPAKDIFNITVYVYSFVVGILLLAFGIINFTLYTCENSAYLIKDTKKCLKDGVITDAIFVGDSNVGISCIVIGTLFIVFSIAQTALYFRDE